jgi:hypothetical protein
VIQATAGSGRVTPDRKDRPLGEIMQVRKIYSASARVRRHINHQPETEPLSPDEVLPYPELPAGTSAGTASS